MKLWKVFNPKVNKPFSMGGKEILKTVRSWQDIGTACWANPSITLHISHILRLGKEIWYMDMIQCVFIGTFILWLTRHPVCCSLRLVIKIKGVLFFEYCPFRVLPLYDVIDIIVWFDTRWIDCIYTVYSKQYLTIFNLSDISPKMM